MMSEMSELEPRALAAFRDIPEATFDAFRQSLSDDPEMAKDLYAQFLQTNPRLAIRILQQGAAAEDPSSYWEGVNNVLGPLARFGANKLFEHLLDDGPEQQAS